jgi:hypothetical protein
MTDSPDSYSNLELLVRTMDCSHNAGICKETLANHNDLNYGLRGNDWDEVLLCPCQSVISLPAFGS